MVLELQVVSQGPQLTKIDDELDDLEAGNPLLPPNADATGRLEVVPVHDDVDGEVQGDGNPGDSSRADELGVAEEGSRAVVVAVEEGWDPVSKGARCEIIELDALRGFFLRNRKTVSSSSRYLVR